MMKRPCGGDGGRLRTPLQHRLTRALAPAALALAGCAASPTVEPTAMPPSTSASPAPTGGRDIITRPAPRPFTPRGDPEGRAREFRCAPGLLRGWPLQQPEARGSRGHQLRHRPGWVRHSGPARRLGPARFQPSFAASFRTSESCASPRLSAASSPWDTRSCSLQAVGLGPPRNRLESPWRRTSVIAARQPR